MKLVISLFLILGLSYSAHARIKEYDDCILEFLKGAKNDRATQLIQKSCDQLYKKFHPAADRKKRYYNCLLEYLVGVESDNAVQLIQKSCDEKYLKIF